MTNKNKLDVNYETIHVYKTNFIYNTNYKNKQEDLNIFNNYFDLHIFTGGYVIYNKFYSRINRTFIQIGNSEDYIPKHTNYNKRKIHQFLIKDINKTIQDTIINNDR